MNPEKRQKLTKIPAPPDHLSPDGAKHFKQIAGKLLEAGRLTADRIDDIAALAYIDAWQDQIIRKRRRVVTILGFDLPRDETIKLNDPYVFDDHFMIFCRCTRPKRPLMRPWKMNTGVFLAKGSIPGTKVTERPSHGA